MIIPQIYISPERDVYYNIALESYILKTMKSDTALILLWYSDEAVVIGKHQNIWRECDISYCNDYDIPIARRCSGGGAVFLDRNTLNFSFISPKSEYNTDQSFSLIIHWLTQMGLKDITYNKSAICEKNKKISGNAFCIKKNNAMHHGTLLIDTNLDALHNTLHSSLSVNDDNGVKSQRMDVVNLKTLDSNLDQKKILSIIKNSLNSYFKTEVSFITGALIKNETLFTEEYNKIKENDWIFGGGPESGIVFDFLLPFGTGTLTINIKKGTVKNAVIESDNDTLNELVSQYFFPVLLGEKFIKSNIVCKNKKITIKYRILNEFVIWVESLKF